MWDREGGSNSGQIPYVAQYTTAWSTYGSVPGMGIRYADGTYEFIGTWPTGVRVDIGFAVSSTPDERGNVFLLPMRCRCNGIEVMLGGNNTLSTHDIVFYGPSGDVLRSKTMDTDQVGNRVGHAFVYWDPIMLEPDVPYRLVAKPTSTSQVMVREHAVLHAAMMGGLPGGSRVYKTSRTDGGAWTDDATARTWWLSLNIDQIDDGRHLPRTRSLRTDFI